MAIYSKTLLMLAALLGLFVSDIATADFRDYNYKAWAHRPGSARSVARPRSYRRATPVIVRSEPIIVRSESVPTTVAQAPTEQRSFSYDPAQPADSSVSQDCVGVTEAVQMPATAQPSTQRDRSYSYEPSMSTSTTQPSARSYSAPRMQSSRSSGTPRFLLQKTDPRKYRN